MKQKASFRINEQLHDKLKAFANSQGITTSQLIELACFHFMDEKPMPIRQEKKGKKIERILLDLQVDIRAERETSIALTSCSTC